MRLKLNLNGSAEPFNTYLKSYLRIRESLLLEIDTDARCFVAKTFTEDHSAIRFSSLSFDDAHVTIVDDVDVNERENARIKVGILIRLKKFIQIVERFGSDVNEKGECNFDILIEYAPMDYKSKNGVEMIGDFVTTEISFTSDILKMKLDGFRISEIDYLSDDAFFSSAFSVNDPISINVNSTILSSIIKTSDIIKIDLKRDVLIFYAEGKTLYVRDMGEGKDKQPNFVYRIGDVNFEPNYKVYVPISRDRFIRMMDKCDEDFKLILGQVNSNGNGLAMDRILFDSNISNTKIAISAMREN